MAKQSSDNQIVTFIRGKYSPLMMQKIRQDWNNHSYFGITKGRDFFAQ